MKTLIAMTLVAIVSVAIDAVAQTPKIDESAWITVASEKAEFSLRMPKSTLVHVDETERFPRTTLFGFDGGVSIRFVRTKTPLARETFRASTFAPSAKAVAAEQKIEDVDLRTVISNAETYRLNISAASDSKFYLLLISGASKDDPAIAYVLRSIRIKGKPIVESKDGPERDDNAPIELNSLKTSPEIAEALKAKRPKWNGKVTYEPLAAYKKTEPDKSVREPVELTALRPKFNFVPMLKGGLIRFSVVFKADGTIGDMTFYSDADRSILAAYADGAREMRFLPAVGSDGKTVDFAKEFLLTFGTSSRTFIL